METVEFGVDVVPPGAMREGELSVFVPSNADEAITDAIDGVKCAPRGKDPCCALCAGNDLASEYSWESERMNRVDH